MSLIQAMGMHIDLETPEQIARATQLAEKYPGTYEVADFKTKHPSPEYPNNWNSWNLQCVTIPRLYSMVGHPHADNVTAWVLEGMGEEPGKHNNS